MGAPAASAEVVTLPVPARELKRSSGAERAALRRRREREGLDVYQVEVSRRTVEAMMDAGWITEFAGKVDIARALAVLIDQAGRAMERD
jgi:hypothetical protein